MTPGISAQVQGGAGDDGSKWGGECEGRELEGGREKKREGTSQRTKSKLKSNVVQATWFDPFKKHKTLLRTMRTLNENGHSGEVAERSKRV